MIRPTNSGTTPSTSSATNTTTTTNGGTISTANSNEVKGNVAAKVSEVFLTASHAFQKIGDLTMQLSHMNSKPESEESKWSDKEIDQLKDALSRFADELDNISTSVQARMKKQIKIDIRRGLGNTNSRTPTLSNPGTASTGSQSYQQYLSTKRPSTSSQPSSSSMLSNGPPPTKRFAYATTSAIGSPNSQMTSYRPVSINAAGRTVTLQPISRQRYVNVPAGSGNLTSSLSTTSSISQSWSTVDPEPTDIFEQPTTSFSPASLTR